MTSGLIYFSDDERQAGLVYEGGHFTDALPSSPKIEVRQVALLCFRDDAFSHAGVVTRGQKTVSYKWRVRFDEFQEIDPPLPVAELSSLLPDNVAELLNRGARVKGVQLSTEMWAEVSAAIASLRPEVDLDHLTRLASARRLRPPGDGREPIVAYESDAVGLALGMAGIDRKPILESWTGSDDAPFLEGLSEFNALEDRMIELDATVFGSWTQVRRGAVGISEFREGKRKLTVVNVNRAGVEHALGVDLVYYNHDFKSYVLVQYKRMTPRRDDSGFEFRPDKQLREELARMRKLLPAGSTPGPLGDYRLDDEGVYLKLCPSTVREAFAHELIRGMYLPLRYWDALMEAPETRGPRGGIVVDFDTTGRHFSNSLFVDLVSAGWVGTRGATTEQVTKIVQESLATRSLILADARSMTTT